MSPTNVSPTDVSPATIPQDSPSEGRNLILKTARLVLRAPRMADAAALAALAADRRVAENTSRLPHPYGLADAEDFIAAVRAGSEHAFVVAREADGAILGVSGLSDIAGSTPEIGYWFGVPHWGRGYATEAARALIDHVFCDLDHEALEGAARISNPASRRVLEKCGFQWTGAALQRFHAINSSAPIDRFRLDRNLWASLKSWGAATETAA